MTMANNHGTPDPPYVVDNNGARIPLSELSALIAEYGSTSATPWLEHDRYKLWRPPAPLPGSPFPSIQGYLQHDPFVFAWGNPVIADPALLPVTARAFIEWCAAQGFRLVWCCVDHDLEDVLAHEFHWCTVTCIHEDIVDPTHVVELASEHSKGKEGAALVKDLKKNIRRAERQGVVVKEVRPEEWTEQDKEQVEAGVEEWKAEKTGSLASSSFYPWLDFEHRRYWLARKGPTIVGLLILTPIKHYASYQVKNAIAFASAPRGTSEELIFTALKDLVTEPKAKRSSDTDASAADVDSSRHNGSPESEDTEANARQRGLITVNFGISASDDLKAVENLSGWKITWLAKMYSSVARTTGLSRRGRYRNKFDPRAKPMYVCYPEDGFGLEGLHSLLKVMSK